MSETIRKYTIKYPAARATTIQYLAKREETTKKLMKEILDEQLRRTPRPWWKRVFTAALKRRIG